MNSRNGNSLMPLNRLDEVAVECLGEEETTERVTALIGTVGVHFTSRVIGGNVDLVLLDETSNLDIGGGLDELNTGQSALGDDTGTIAGLCAPSNGLRNKKGRGSEQNGDRTREWKDTNLALNDTNFRVGLGRAPEAEVVNTVDNGGLAERIWALGL